VSVSAPRAGEISFYLSLRTSAASLDDAAVRAPTPGSSDHRHSVLLGAAALNDSGYGDGAAEG
jgi:hypothetical protein